MWTRHGRFLEGVGIVCEFRRLSTIWKVRCRALEQVTRRGRCGSGFVIGRGQGVWGNLRYTGRRQLGGYL